MWEKREWSVALVVDSEANSAMGKRSKPIKKQSGKERGLRFTISPPFGILGDTMSNDGFVKEHFCLVEVLYQERLCSVKLCGGGFQSKAPLKRSQGIRGWKPLPHEL